MRTAPTAEPAQQLAIELIELGDPSSELDLEITDMYPSNS